MSMKKQSLGTAPANPLQEIEMRLLYRAAIGDVHETEKILATGVSINAADYNGRTCLHLAAERGHIDMVECLVRLGAEVNGIDHTGNTALNLAARHNHKIVQSLLRIAGAETERNRNESESKPAFLSAKRCMRAVFTVVEAFPRPIAMAMLQGRKVEPISKANVSLLFSDIVGFTNLSSDLESRKVSSLLNRLFSKFDRCAYIHGVQKIDVIGDAYIAATNFTTEQSGDHAARLARFAIDMVKVSRETIVDEECPARCDCIQIRVGMHCGAVSASMIGTQNFKYTVMGDAVNIASRMESTALPGKIQCSDEMGKLISQQADDVLLKTRKGGVNIKGKGCMKSFWISSLRHHSRHSHGSCPDLRSLLGGSAHGEDLESQSTRREHESETFSQTKINQLQ